MRDQQRQKSDEAMPELDENWWIAVMADEEKFIAEQQLASLEEETPAPRPKPNHTDVNWQRVVELQEGEEALACQVVGFNRGGLLVEADGFHGFVPLSHLLDVLPVQMEEERGACLAAYVGKEIHLQVIECDPQRGRVVLSERAAQTAPGERQRLFDSLQTGKIVHGEVTNITEFGLFIDLGGVEGLVHISELSWGRVCHPKEHAKIGQRLEVLVLQIDSERGRVALSLKRLCDNPWETVAERYQLGQVVYAVVTDVVQFGVFARLEEGLEGLIHVSQMGCGEHAVPAQVVKPGEGVKARILQIDASRQRMSLRLENDQKG